MSDCVDPPQPKQDLVPTGAGLVHNPSPSFDWQFVQTGWSVPSCSSDGLRGLKILAPGHLRSLSSAKVVRRSLARDFRGQAKADSRGDATAAPSSYNSATS